MDILTPVGRFLAFADSEMFICVLRVLLGQSSVLFTLGMVLSTETTSIVAEQSVNLVTGGRATAPYFKLRRDLALWFCHHK